MNLLDILGGDQEKLSALSARFWPKVAVGAPEECWEWTAYRRSSGYGLFSVRSGFPVNAQRVAYALVNGSIPEGLFVCHHCDNPPCCNPAHLYAGTPRENAADMVRRGRSALPGGKPGETNPNARFTYEQANDIRRAHLRDDLDRFALAAIHEVKVSTIDRLLSGRTYKPRNEEEAKLVRPALPKPADRTHCPQGHPLDRFNPDGRRYCGTCKRDKARSSRAKKAYEEMAKRRQARADVETHYASLERLGDAS